MVCVCVCVCVYACVVIVVGVGVGALFFLSAVLLLRFGAPPYREGIQERMCNAHRSPSHVSLCLFVPARVCMCVCVCVCVCARASAVPGPGDFKLGSTLNSSGGVWSTARPQTDVDVKEKVARGQACLGVNPTFVLTLNSLPPLLANPGAHW